MAGTSTKDIKNRIKSVENTGQITKAMELVATSKLRQAKKKVESTRPFFEILEETLFDIEKNTRDFSSVYTKKREIKKTLVVVIGGDRGLAGGYNINVFKKANEIISEGASVILPIGKKALEYYEKQGEEVLMDAFDKADDFKIPHCYEMGTYIAGEYKKGSFDRVVVVYTKFVSMLSQVPEVKEVLPLCADKECIKKGRITLYEPSQEAVFDKIIPQYISGVLYSALCEALASEHGARRTSMESASKNASQMIDELTLKFNRARQAAITQEITEIVSGAEA